MGVILMTFAVMRKGEPMSDFAEDTNVPTNDCISRQSAIDAIRQHRENVLGDYEYDDGVAFVYAAAHNHIIDVIERLPSVQPEIIRCKDCRWWDKYDDYDNGYCMAAKHGYWSEHWEISIRRTYKGDFYCADAEPKGEQECHV